ncbi:hypothetical protein [Lacinutrix salivirga]
MKIYAILICVLFLNCNTKNKQDQTITYNQDSKPKVESKIQTMDFKDIMSLNKNEAIKKYGKPIKSHSESLDNLQGEFYNSLQDAYKDLKTTPTLIQIEELIWTKDSLHNITVWYQKEAKESLPKAHLIWEKGSEF